MVPAGTAVAIHGGQFHGCKHDLNSAIHAPTSSSIQIPSSMQVTGPAKLKEWMKLEGIIQQWHWWEVVVGGWLAKYNEKKHKHSWPPACQEKEMVVVGHGLTPMAPSSSDFHCTGTALGAF